VALAATHSTINVPAHTLGDLLVCAALVRNDDEDGAATVNTAGWNPFPDNPYGGANHARQALFWKIGNGSETAVSITGTGGTSADLFLALVNRFTAADGFHATPIESIAMLAGTDNTPDAPTVTPGGVNRLAVCVVGLDEHDATVDPFSGESGGDWAEHTQQSTTSGGGGLLQIQSSDQSGGGQISGGTMSATAAPEWTAVAFAIRPADV
jgi:hypothetical protein